MSFVPARSTRRRTLRFYGLIRVHGHVWVAECVCVCASMLFQWMWWASAWLNALLGSAAADASVCVDCVQYNAIHSNNKLHFPCRFVSHFVVTFSCHASSWWWRWIKKISNSTQKLQLSYWRRWIMNGTSDSRFTFVFLSIRKQTTKTVLNADRMWFPHCARCRRLTRKGDTTLNTNKRRTHGRPINRWIVNKFAWSFRINKTNFVVFFLFRYCHGLICSHIWIGYARRFSLDDR